jgi:lipoteichoic acid synthase
MKGLKVTRDIIQSMSNELIYSILFLKIILFHTFTDTTLSSGVFSTSIGFLLLFYAFSFLFKNKWRLLYSLIVNLLISIVLFSNTLYLDYYSSPITISTFYQTTNLSGLGDSILYLFHYKYLLFLTDLIFLPFFFIRRTFLYQKAPSMIKGFIPFCFVGMLAISLKPVKLVYLDHMENPIQAYDSLDLIVQYGLIGHHALDAYFHIRDANFTLSSEDRKRIEKQLSQKPTIQIEHDYEGMGKGKNLIMIQVESLQHFVLNKEIDGQEITPTLNDLLKNSLVFPNFYAQTIGGNSSDAEFLTQTSLFPLKTGSVFFRYPYNTYHSIGGALKDQGYATLAVHADEKTFWNRDHMYPSLGFDDYITIEDFPQKEIIGMGVGDKEMFTETPKILGKQAKPFYSLLVTLTNHMPYEMLDDHKSLSLPDSLENSLLGDYFQTVRYTDEALALFIDSLKEQKLLEDSIIVIYGDHNGIFHRDKPLLEKWLQKEISTEEWYRTFATVPFIVYHPSIKETTNYTIGGQVDVFPTIGSIMGLSNKISSTSLGINLLAAPNNTVMIPSGGYVEKPLSITGESIKAGLTDREKNLLDISNLIIKGDYFSNER